MEGDETKDESGDGGKKGDKGRGCCQTQTNGGEVGPNAGAQGQAPGRKGKGAFRGQQKKPLRAVPGVARDATAVRAGAASSGIVALRI